MTLYIIRHGQTLWNLQNRKQGNADSPLTLKGIKQAENVVRILHEQELDFDQVEFHVSPLFRTQQYAQIITEHLGYKKELRIDHLLREHGFGFWEGLTQEEVDERFPGETEKRKQDWWNYIIPGGGESYELITHRVQYFLSTLDMGKTHIFVCHEMISKVMRGILLDMSNEETLLLGHPQDTIYKIKNGSLSELK